MHQLSSIEKCRTPAISRQTATWFLFALLAVGMATMVQSRLAGAIRERDAVDRFRRLGGIVLYDHELSGWNGREEFRNDSALRRWTRQKVGRDLFATVAYVNLGLTSISDSDLAILPDLLKTRCRLEIDATPITSDGLAHLPGIPHLEMLSCVLNDITDTGMRHIGACRSLRWLALSMSHVTDAGIEHLKDLRELDRLVLDQNEITDDAIEHLTRLQNLSYLSLRGCDITDNGIDFVLQLKALRGLSLSRTRVTHRRLHELAALPHLERLGIHGLNITDDQYSRIQASLPKCKIER